MVHKYYVPCRQCSSLQCLSIGFVPLIVTCLLVHLSTLDAAALHGTGRASSSHRLPDNQLRPDDVQKDVNKSKIDQVSSLTFSEFLTGFKQYWYRVSSFNNTEDIG